jgi:hypothetical protein
MKRVGLKTILFGLSHGARAMNEFLAAEAA